MEQSQRGADLSNADWPTVADELVRLAQHDDRAELHRRVTGLLGAGHVHPLAAALDHLGEQAPLPLPLRVLRADLAARDQSVELHQLIDLEYEVRAADPADPALEPWMTAILAEWGLWRGDFATFGSVLGAPDTDPDADPLAELAAGRRRRISALVATVTDPLGTGTAEQTERARQAFERCGAAEEQAMTDCLLGYARLSISDDLSPEPLEIIRRGVKELERIGADRLAVGLAFLAWSTYMMGDFVECADALDRYEEAAAGVPLPPVVTEGVAILHALSRMILDGATDDVVTRLAHHLDQLRRATVPTWFVGPVANDLIDHGQVELAAEVNQFAAAVPNVMRAAHQSIREVDARIRLLRDRDRRAIEDLWALLGEWEAVGRARRAAASAVRCSWTCRLAGFEAEADRFLSWGAERLPDPGQRTAWEERYLAGPATDGRHGVRRGTLRVLVPDVVVTRGDREVRLGDMQARLMAVLAAARRPVTTDWVVTALWPEADLESGRNRLAALVHRIRQRLDLLPDELLRRTRHGLELDGHGWSVDVWQFWDLSDGNDDDRERALELYQSDLAARQLAYDDLLDEQRELLRARWQELLRSLVDGGRLSQAEAAARAHRIGAAWDRSEP